MIESQEFRGGSIQTLIDVDVKRDRLVRGVTILSWVVTFLVLIGFAVVVGQEASRALTLAHAGMVREQEVLRTLIPLFVVVGTTSLLMALVSTAALFLRQRTASLADIQLRLATLETLLASETANDR
jgi:uncharacterized membrane protein YidH (DUF202 family)